MQHRQNALLGKYWMKDSATFRRMVGLLLGLGLGLAYGLSSQTINRIMLPGIMLHQPPLGLPGNILLWTMAAAALGLATAWPKESLIGAILGGTMGASILTVVTLITGRTDAEVWAGKLLGTLFLFIPIAGLLIPLTGVFRWTVNKTIEARVDKEPVWYVVRWPVLLLVLVVAIGTFALLPPHARIMLTRTDEMLKKGLELPTQNQLPEPLQNERVGGFIEHAGDKYTLEWENTDINRFAIPRPLTEQPWEESVVIAYFNSGWKLVCLYADSDASPACRGFEDP
jgi:MFS family permease